MHHVAAGHAGAGGEIRRRGWVEDAHKDYRKVWMKSGSILRRSIECSNSATLFMEAVMGVHTVSSRELNQDIGRAKRTAHEGPVVITDRGRPSHVLLSWADYRRLSGGPRNLAEVLAAPGLSDIPFAPEKSGLKTREVDFS